MELNENQIIRNNIKTSRLLTESVDRRDIIDAIENKRIIYIYYAGDSTVNRGYRTIEPHAYGKHSSTTTDKKGKVKKTSTGNFLLRAWQQAGASDSKIGADRPNDEIPGWRLFNVEGITSWMPVLGRVKNFSTPRPNYNPNDSQLDVIASVDYDAKVDTSGTKNTDSIDDPNMKSSVFDKQADKFKKFSIESNDFQYQKTLSDIYGRVKFSRKQNPNNYIVVIDNDGELTYKPSSYEDKYDPDNVVGNLSDLFNEISDVKNPNSDQFYDHLKQLNSKASLLGGDRRRPIDKSFFNNKYNEFANSLAG